MQRIIVFWLLLLGHSWLLPQEDSKSLVNTAHLDHLYSDRILGGVSVGVVGIYAEYPDYHIVEDADEGIACVDDAARAGVFYINQYRQVKQAELLRKGKQLIRFILYMQAPEGYFYNFVFADGRVNTTFKTSVAQPNWWSWRAFYLLADTYETVRGTDKALADSMATAMNRLIEKISPLYNQEKQYRTKQGFSVPAWLPWEHAADQAAVLVKALCKYFIFTQDPRAMQLIKYFADGIIAMQITDRHSAYYGAFLSWENLWHGWGNNQSDALLSAFEVTRETVYKESALREIQYFYKHLVKKKFYAELSFRKNDDEVFLINSSQGGQIAYIIRPMIWAALHAYEVTKDSSLKKQALEISGWLFGNNIAGKRMYNWKNGRTFDGINSAVSVNRNSGAESTIEALLALQALESYADIKSAMLIKYRK